MADNRLRHLITEIAVGSAVGAAAAGELGAAVGAALGAAGPSFTWGINELADRVLSRAQQERVATAIAVAMDSIERRLQEGDELSEWIAASIDERKHAKRFVEGVLVTVQQDYDERKARHYGYLLANIAFEESLDPLAAHTFLGIAQDVSYPQLQLISLIERKNRIGLPPSDARGNKIGWNAASVRYQLDELGFGRLELIGAHGRKTGRMGLPVPNLAVADMELRPRGKALHLLMELRRIPNDELEPIAQRLWDSCGLSRPAS